MAAMTQVDTPTMSATATEPATARPSAAKDATDALPRRPPGFGLVLIGTAVLFVLAGLAANFLGNSTGFFDSPVRPAMSDRSWKTRRLDEAIAAGRAPKVLVMGSSRMMQVRPAYVEGLTGKPCFNYGVSAATPVDFITQLRYVLRRGAKPDLLIVGVDEVACAGLSSRYFYQAMAHWGLLASMPVPERLDAVSGVLRMLTPQSTLQSLVMLWEGKPRHRKLRQVSSVLMSDGYLLYRDHTLRQAVGTEDLVAEIQRTAQRWSDGLAREFVPDQALKLNQRKLQLLSEFVELARQNGIEVRVVLLPLHPDYERLVFNDDMRVLRETLRRRLSELSDGRRVIFRDYTSVASYGGDPKQFWDGAHQQPENLRRMLNALFDRDRDWIAARPPSDMQLLNHLPPGTTLDTW